MTQTTIQSGAAPKKACITAADFVARHGLSLSDFYAILSRKAHGLPDVVGIAGEPRFHDIAGANGVKFAPAVRLEMLPEDAHAGECVEVGEFCATWGLGADDLLRLAMRRSLPAAYSSERHPGKVVIAATDAHYWALARHADLAAR